MNLKPLNLPLDAIARFIEQLETIKLKAASLEFDGYPERAITANIFCEELDKGFKRYRAQEISKEDFRNLCATKIVAIQQYELKNHRRWKEVLFNLALALAGLGVGYVIAVCNHLYQTEGKHFFF